MRPNRRPPKEIWEETRRKVWERDGGYCQGPYCKGALPLSLEECHIDHIVPLSSGGTNSLDNQHVLCRRCHFLRADQKHRGLIRQALKDEIIPPNWRPLVWE